MYSRRSAFTLVEILVTIAILAVLVATGLFAYVSVTSWAKSTADRQTLTILNDALSRYKTQGGNVSALTVGANIGQLLSRMENATSWGDVSHQFLAQGVTYPARSIGAMGSHASYNFYRFNTYSSQTPAVGTPTSDYIYGQGVGSMSDESSAYAFNFTTTTGYLAVKESTGTVTIFGGNEVSLNSSVPSITFWSCAGAADSTPSGTVTDLFCSGAAYTAGITAIDVTGLTGLVTFDCSENQISSLNLSGLTSMTTVYCGSNLLTSISFAGLNALTEINCTGNNWTSLTISNLPLLETLEAGSSGMTSITISNLPALSHVGVAGSSLNASALNTLYTALPSRVSLSAGFVGRIGNPGAGGATNSIATSKNWTMH